MTTIGPAPSGAIDSRVRSVRILFEQTGAATIFHGAESMVRHAERTYKLLEAWGCSDDVRLAGLLHSVYAVLVDNGPEGRRRIAELVGQHAEEIVYVTATVPRVEIERRLELAAANDAVWQSCGLIVLASDIALLGVVPLSGRQLESVRRLATLCLSHIAAPSREELIRLFRLGREPSAGSWVRSVADGYDRIAAKHAKFRPPDSDDVRVLAELSRVLPPAARVLDLGCGDGTVISRRLAERYAVFGLDISWQQLLMARETAGAPRLVCADLLNLPYRDGAFDAVCSYYAIVHLPRATHGQVVYQIHQVLRSEGWALLCLGADDVPGRHERDFLGAPMWFSHYDGEENLRLLSEQGLTVRWSHVVGEGTPARFLFALAQRG